MKNLPKEKRDRIVLIVVGTAVLLAAAWYVLISTSQKKLELTRKNVTEQQARVEGAKRLLNATGDVEKRLAKSVQKLRDIEDGMASGDMYSWIILKVNKFRAGYNVDIPQFTREVTGDVGMLPKFPYKAATFNVRGTAYFHDLGRFLADFENSFPYLRVQNLELEPVSGASAASTGAAASHSGPAPVEEFEKVGFRMEIVTLINPTAR